LFSSRFLDELLNGARFLIRPIKNLKNKFGWFTHFPTRTGDSLLENIRVEKWMAEEEGE